MSTTTIRLPDDLKERVAELARRAGMTPHGYILEAIAEKTRQETVRAEFDAEADARLAGIVASGQTLPWSEFRSQLEKRFKTSKAPRSTPRKTRR